jgi:DNA-binding SARP family transcriptional activator
MSRPVGQDGTMTAAALDIAFVRVLGPIQVVTTSGDSVDLASSSQRRLVALLAAEAPRSVRAEQIQDVLAVSPSALRTTVSRVRGALGAGAIASPPGHYRLTLPVDAVRFSDALSEVAESGSSADRADSLRAALELWSGPPYDEFAGEE